MKLFRHSSGIILAFGFDMLRREPNPNMIAWSDIDGVTWECENHNQAGWINQWRGVDPEFIFERDGKIIAYQPGLCIEMTYAGPPIVWSVAWMRPDRETKAFAA